MRETKVEVGVLVLVVVVVLIVVVVVAVVVVVVEVVVVVIVVVDQVVVEVVVEVVAIEFEEDVVLVGVGSSARLELPKSGINGCRKGGVNMSCQLQAPMLVVLDFQVVLLGDVISLF